MAYLDEIKQRNASSIQRGVAYGNMWPQWEQQSPQYPQPNPYNLAQLGYRKDELVFSCIDYRAQTISEPPAMLFKGKGQDKKPISGLFDSFPRGQPNTEMGEAEFWMVSEIYRMIAGNAIWEIETNHLGKPINLWPLNPSYISFKRGHNRPIDKVVYLYPGLPPVDIPREKCIVLQEFDPIYPMLKGLSRTAVAMRAVGVHSSTSDFLSIFFQRGAVIQGYLKFSQELNDVEAARARTRWREQHGGAGNWGENNIGVLGQGADYVHLQMNMRDMAFADIDGRTESQICMVFGLSPILMGAKVGLRASTLANYEQAEKHYLNRVVQPSWRWYASELSQQLVPLLTDDEEVYCAFDTSAVASLKEDENALWARVLQGTQSNLIYRDEARAKLSLDPVDGGAQVFLGVTLQGGQAPAEAARIAAPEWVAPEEEPEPELSMAPAPFTTTTGGIEFSAPMISANEEQLKAWRAMALTTTAPIGTPFDNELAACHTNTQKRAVFEAHWPTRKAELNPVDVLDEYNQLTKRLLAQGK
jgi:HK97 family phage portal protein